MTEIEPLLTPAEVGRALRVDPKTVARWAATGKLPCVRTLGGHRRYRQSHIDAIQRGEPIPEDPKPAPAPAPTLDVPAADTDMGIGLVTE